MSSCVVTGAGGFIGGHLVADLVAQGVQVGGAAEGHLREGLRGLLREDVGILATSADAPLSYWLLGGADPSLFTTGDMTDPALQRVPSNHSPKYAPVLEPTLTLGVTALVTATRTWLPAA